MLKLGRKVGFDIHRFPQSGDFELSLDL